MDPQRQEDRDTAHDDRSDNRRRDGGGERGPGRHRSRSRSPNSRDRQGDTRERDARDRGGRSSSSDREAKELNDRANVVDPMANDQGPRGAPEAGSADGTEVRPKVEPTETTEGTESLGEPLMSGGAMETDEDADSLGEPLVKFQDVENPDHTDVTVVGWSGNIRNRKFIVRYGPKNSGKYRIQNAAEAPADYDTLEPPLDQFIGHPEDRIGHKKERGRYVYTKRHLDGIYGVAWFGELDTVKALKQIDPNQRERGERWKPTFALVAWKKDGKIDVKWEDRSSLRARYGKDKADEYIYKAAKDQELRYQTYVDGTRPAGSRWPTPSASLAEQLERERQRSLNPTSARQAPLPSVENQTGRETRSKSRRPLAPTSGNGRSREQTPAMIEIREDWKQSYLELIDLTEADMESDPKAMARYTTAWRTYRNSPDYARELASLA